MTSSGLAHLPVRKVALAVADLIVAAAALVVALVLRFGYDQGIAYLEERHDSLVATWALMPALFYLFGLYDDRGTRSRVREVASAATSAAGSVALLGAIGWATSAAPLGRGVALAFFTLLLAGLWLVRTVSAFASHHGLLCPRCLVIGDAVAAAAVTDLVGRHPNADLRIVGRIDPTLDGALDGLEALVERSGADRLLLGPRLENDQALLRRLRSLRYRGVAIVDFVTLHERLARAVPLGLVDEAWLYRAAVNTSRLHIRRLKRAVDVAVSLVLLAPTVLVVLPLAAIAIKLTSRGPILFRQERLGLGGVKFELLKLRTMREDAERLTGPVWASENDPRITPVGGFLRKFRIDELPQLFNVLRGEMSLVGPRPEREVFTRQLCARQPLYAERLQVPPGVTGWAQVMAPYAATLDDSLRKLEFDLYYAKHLSLFLDLFILLKTAETVLFGRERAQGGLVAGQHPEDASSATGLAPE